MTEAKVAAKGWPPPPPLLYAAHHAFLLLIFLVLYSAQLSGFTPGTLWTNLQQKRAAAAPLHWPGAPPPLPACNLTLLSGQLPSDSAVWSRLEPDISSPTHADQGPSSFSAQIALQHCTLRRLTASEVRGCLANRPLVFIGDSITRYAYLSLVAFLEHGAWPSLADQPSLLFKKQWGAKGELFPSGAAPLGLTCRRCVPAVLPHLPAFEQHAWLSLLRAASLPHPSSPCTGCRLHRRLPGPHAVRLQGAD